MYIKNVYCSKTGQSFVRSKLYVSNQSFIFHTWSAKMCLFKWDLIIICTHYMVCFLENWRLIRNGSLGLRLATSLILASKIVKMEAGFILGWGCHKPSTAGELLRQSDFGIWIPFKKFLWQRWIIFWGKLNPSLFLSDFHISTYILRNHILMATEFFFIF